MALFQRARSLRRALENSPWLVIAISLHVGAIAVTSVIYVQSKSEEPERAPGTFRIRPHEEVAAVFALPEIPPRELRAPIPNDPAEVLPPDEFLDAVPVNFADALEDLSLPAGDPSSLADAVPNPGQMSSTSIGVGDAPGQRGVGPTGRFNQRGTGVGERVNKPGRHVGAKQETEEAVFDGLCWLLRHQNDDGSWTADGFAHQCVETSCAADDVRVSPHFDEGLTSLALLAFLGAGYGHDARQTMVDHVKAKRHVLGNDVTAGLKWLRERQREDGSFSEGGPFLYNEALATMALCEAYGMSGNRYWKQPAQRAVDFLVRAQKSSPQGTGRWGWRYRARPDVPPSGELSAEQALELSDADSSVTTWVVMALKSAELAELEVPREALDGALAFTRWASTQDGQVGYLDPAQAGAKVAGVGDHFAYHSACMSALGICTRAFAAHDPRDAFFEQAASRLLADLPHVSKDRLGVDYYYWYYGSLALNQLDGPDSPRRTGKYWPKWNAAMVEAVLALQDDHEKRCSHGGWTVPDRWSLSAGPVYSTALNVLTLEVYYRYPNAFGGHSDFGAEAQVERAK